MCLPTFRCSREKEDSIYLHYIPGKRTRKGLSPLLVGIIKCMAEEFLHLQSLKIKQKKWIDRGANEDVFSIKWKAVGVQSLLFSSYWNGGWVLTSSSIRQRGRPRRKRRPQCR